MECSQKESIGELKDMIREYMKAQEDRDKRIYTTIYGNGTPGLVTRMALVESRGWWIPVLIAVSGVFFSGLAAFAAVKGL